METATETDEKAARLPAALIVIAACCWLEVALVAARLATGTSDPRNLVYDCGSAGVALLVALGIHARRNAARLFLIVCLTALLIAVALMGIYLAVLWGRAGVPHGGWGEPFAVALAAASLLLLWLYCRLLGTLCGAAARAWFVRRGADPEAMERERWKERLAGGAGLVAGVFFLAAFWGERGPFGELLGRGRGAVPAAVTAPEGSAGAVPAYKEYGFADFGFRVRLDTNEWQEISTERMKNREILTFLVMIPGGRDYCSLWADRAAGRGSDAERLAGMVRHAEKGSRMIVSRGSAHVSGKRVPCVVSRDPRPGAKDRFSAECRWFHAGVEFWLTMRSGSQNPLDVPRFQHFLSGIELGEP